MTPRDLINGIIEKGYSCREIAAVCGGNGDNYSSVAIGYKEKSGNLRILKDEYHRPLQQMYDQTRGLVEGEHKYGKPRDWVRMIKALCVRGFSYTHQGDIVGCNATHLRDVVSPAARRKGRKRVPMLRVQERLAQLYEDTAELTAKSMRNGNKRNHDNMTMIKTIGQGWQV